MSIWDIFSPDEAEAAFRGKIVTDLLKQKGLQAGGWMPTRELQEVLQEKFLDLRSVYKAGGRKETVLGVPGYRFADFPLKKYQFIQKESDEPLRYGYGSEVLKNWGNLGQERTLPELKALMEKVQTTRRTTLSPKAVKESLSYLGKYGIKEVSPGKYQWAVPLRKIYEDVLSSARSYNYVTSKKNVQDPFNEFVFIDTELDSRFAQANLEDFIREEAVIAPTLRHLLRSKVSPLIRRHEARYLKDPKVKEAIERYGNSLYIAGEQKIQSGQVIRTPLDIPQITVPDKIYGSLEQRIRREVWGELAAAYPQFVGSKITPPASVPYSTLPPATSPLEDTYYRLLHYMGDRESLPYKEAAKTFPGPFVKYPQVLSEVFNKGTIASKADILQGIQKSVEPRYRYELTGNPFSQQYLQVKMDPKEIPEKMVESFGLHETMGIKGKNTIGWLDVIHHPSENAWVVREIQSDPIAVARRAIKNVEVEKLTDIILNYRPDTTLLDKIITNAANASSPTKKGFRFSITSPALEVKASSIEGIKQKLEKVFLTGSPRFKDAILEKYGEFALRGCAENDPRVIALRNFIHQHQDWGEYGIASLASEARKQGVDKLYIYTSEAVKKEQGVGVAKAKTYYDDLPRKMGFVEVSPISIIDREARMRLPAWVLPLTGGLIGGGMELITPSEAEAQMPKKPGWMPFSPKEQIPFDIQPKASREYFKTHYPRISSATAELAGKTIRGQTVREVRSGPDKWRVIVFENGKYITLDKDHLTNTMAATGRKKYLEQFERWGQVRPKFLKEAETAKVLQSLYSAEMRKGWMKEQIKPRDILKDWMKTYELQVSKVDPELVPRDQVLFRYGGRTFQIPKAYAETLEKYFSGKGQPRRGFILKEFK